MFSLSFSFFFPANWSEKTRLQKEREERQILKRQNFIFFNNLLPKLSLTQTLTINDVHLVFAGVITLICFSCLVDKLHFLPRYFSFLNCPVAMEVSSVEPAATCTPFTKWCSRATLTSRLRLHRVLRNAERLVLLMSNVKATTSLCSLQYAS